MRNVWESRLAQRLSTPLRRHLNAHTNRVVQQHLARIQTDYRRALTRLSSELATLADRTAAAERQLRFATDLLEQARQELDGLIESRRVDASRSTELFNAVDETRLQSTQLRDDIELLTHRMEGVELAGATTRSALAATRSLVDKVSARTLSQRAGRDDRLARLATTTVQHPLLSIAIPSFNRPAALAECLASIESEMGDGPDYSVEVCITDDASTDPDAVELAVSFAERWEYASVRRHPSNLGIERNVVAACEPCRGDHLMLLGNDDVLLPGSLAVVLDDLQNVVAPVHIYSKQRINQDGSPRNDVPDVDPIALPVGSSHRFDTLLAAARRRGLVSTFGFIGPIVVLRDRFRAVDPNPYFDLTMYAPMCVIVEAFAHEPVSFHNVATLLHRSPTQVQKHAEAIGRREEEFMVGGDQRRARYFGTTMAAALQRLIDRGALDYGYVAASRESLLTTLPMVEWITANRLVDPSLDERLDAGVVKDAERFLMAVGAGSIPPGR